MSHFLDGGVEEAQAEDKYFFDYEGTELSIESSELNALDCS